jgi:hypothetical protein
MLESRDVELQGFAYEGAGMGLAIRDCWMPWMHYTRRFAAGPAARWQRAVYLGAGLGFARMGRDPQRFHKHLPDRFWSWCIFDGYGYLKGILGNGRQRYLEQCAEPEKLRGYARQAFDQGMGRGIWFLEQGNPERVGSAIQRFPSVGSPTCGAESVMPARTPAAAITRPWRCSAGRRVRTRPVSGSAWPRPRGPVTR